MTNNKIIFIIGASGSGKSTVQNHFIENDAKQYGEFFNIVSHATREPRIKDGEVHGVDYYFISEDEFDQIQKEGHFIQTVGHAGSRKGSTIQEWQSKLEKGNIIMPVLLSSALDIKNRLSEMIPNVEENIHIIYFDISKDVAFNRMAGRYAQEFGISPEEFYNLYIDYNNGITNMSDSLQDVFEEINLRLKDIELLEHTPNYTNHIIKIEDNKDRETIYNEFMMHIEDIFSK